MRLNDLTEKFGLPDFEARVAELSDPRGAQGRRYPLSVFVAVALAGMLARKNTVAEVARWASDAPAEVVKALGGIGIEVGGAAWWRLPSYGRLCAVLSLIDRCELAVFASRIVDAVFDAASVDDHVRFDGKRLRGAARGTDKPLLVACVDSAGRAIGQVRADDGDEVGAVEAMIASLGLARAMVSADAAHCHVATAQAILDAGADYCLALKGNEPTLYALAHALPWGEVDNADESRETGHGRTETRTIRVLAVGGAVRLPFPGLKQIARVRRWTRDEVTGEISHHVMYYLTSRDFRRLRPAEFAALIRGHWAVEAWHWTRDVVFAEDASTARAGYLPENLASLRNAAIAILKQLDLLAGKGITAIRDHISNRPYTTPLRILGIPINEQPT